MVVTIASVLTSNADIDRQFERRSGLIKDYTIDMCCFSAKHTSLRRMSKDWLVRKQYKVSTSLPVN